MSKKAQPLEVGTKAPRFTVKTYQGEKVALADYAGQKVLLYFYPKDDTPGCTKQACNLQENMSDLKKAGVAVIGVSPDDNNSHERFAGKYDLSFPLAPDPDHKIIEKYGVWGEKNLYGNKSMGLVRTSFLIDEEGVIQHVFKRPKTAEHTQEVLSKL